MTTLKAYLLFVFLPNIGVILGVIGLLAFLFFSAVIFFSKISEEQFPTFVLKAWVISLILLFISITIPSKKDLLTIYSVKYLTGNKQQKVINKIPDVILKYFKQYLKDGGKND